MLIVDGINAIERTGNTIKLFINGDKKDYYRQIFESYIVVEYVYLDHEPIIPLIFYHCFVNMTSVESKNIFFVSFSFRQSSPERSLKIRKLKSKIESYGR